RETRRPGCKCCAASALFAKRTDSPVVEARAALRVQHVEGDVRRRGRGVHADGNRDESERDRARADRVRRHGLHDSTMLPMMREGSGSPMDSVPVAVERQDIGAPEPRRRLSAWIVWLLTVLAALVLVSFIAMMVWLQFIGSRVDGIEDPERALALIVGRIMDIDEAVSRAPAWERFVYRVLSTEPAEDLDEGLRWYEELASSSINPT